MGGVSQRPRTLESLARKRAKRMRLRREAAAAALAAGEGGGVGETRLPPRGSTERLRYPGPRPLPGPGVVDGWGASAPDLRSMLRMAEAATRPGRRTFAVSRMWSVPQGPQKVNMVAKVVRGGKKGVRKSVAEALVQLGLSVRKAAPYLATAIRKAAHSAVAVHGLDERRLVVEQVSVSRGQRVKKRVPMGRGKIGSHDNVKSNIRVVVVEEPEVTEGGRTVVETVLDGNRRAFGGSRRGLIRRRLAQQTEMLGLARWRHGELMHLIAQGREDWRLDPAERDGVREGRLLEIGAGTMPRIVGLEKPGDTDATTRARRLRAIRERKRIQLALFRREELARAQAKFTPLATWPIQKPPAAKAA